MSLIERYEANERQRRERSMAHYGHTGASIATVPMFDWRAEALALEAQLAGAVDLLRKSRGYVALYYATHEPDDPAAVIRLLADIDNAIAGGR